MAGEPGVVGVSLDCLALRNEAWPRSWDLGTLESLEVEDPKHRGPFSHCVRPPRDDGLKTKEYPDSQWHSL